MGLPANGQPTYLPGILGRNIQLDVKARFIVKGGDLCGKNAIKALCLVCYILSNKLFTCVEQEIPYSHLLT